MASPKARKSKVKRNKAKPSKKPSKIRQVKVASKKISKAGRAAKKLTGRELQDELIRYLADARVRRRAPKHLPLSSAEAKKAERFALFLARRYYRDRLIRSFRCARLLAPRTGRQPEEIVETTEFSRLLGNCVLGSLETAHRVSDMAVAYLSGGNSPGQWWADLLQYEAGFFLQMATSEPGPGSDRPRPGVSSILRSLTWDVPQLMPRLKAGEMIRAIEENVRRDITLLFSRTREGKVYVVEVEEPVATVFRAVNGKRTAKQIAAATPLAAEQANQVLALLGEIGAVVLPQ